jgi:hypothetical protein
MRNVRIASVSLWVGLWMCLVLALPQSVSSQIVTAESSRQASLEELQRKQQNAKAKSAKRLAREAKQAEKRDARRAAQYLIGFVNLNNVKVTKLYRDCANMLRLRVMDRRTNEELKGVKFIVSLKLATLFSNIDDKNNVSIIPADSVAEIYVSVLNPKNNKLSYLGSLKMPVARMPIPSLSLLVNDQDKVVEAASLSNVKFKFTVDQAFRTQCPRDANYQITEAIVYRRPQTSTSKTVVDTLHMPAGEIVRVSSEDFVGSLQRDDEVSFEITGIQAINFNERPVNLLDNYEYKQLLFNLFYKP